MRPGDTEHTDKYVNHGPPPGIPGRSRNPVRRHQGRRPRLRQRLLDDPPLGVAGVQHPPRLTGHDADVVDATAGAGEKIEVTGPLGAQRHRPGRLGLVGGVAGEGHPEPAPGQMDQAGAVDAVRGEPAPDIGHPPQAGRHIERGGRPPHRRRRTSPRQRRRPSAGRRRRPRAPAASRRRQHRKAPAACPAPRWRWPPAHPARPAGRSRSRRRQGWCRRPRREPRPERVARPGIHPG